MPRMQIDEIRALLEKYQQGLCTAEERKIIDDWYDSLRLDNEGLKGEAIDNSLEKIRGNLKELTGLTTKAAPVTAPVIHPYRWRRDARVAAYALLITVAVGPPCLLFHQPPSVKPALALRQTADTTVITHMD